MRLWSIALIASSQAALADAPARLDVAVGKTIEREVGIAIGYRCDEPTAIIAVEMRQKSEYANVAIITGKKAGTTTCRFGVDPMSYSVVYEIRVVPARRR
ncbi:MAG TPA: hypothetical protein VIU61_13005 [Kofleriaceae bacterium]